MPARWLGSPWWPAPAIALTALLPQALAWPLVTVAIIVLGVPHGALDGEICRSLLMPRHRRTWFALFAVPYMLLFAAVLVAWQVAPLCTLVAFLMASTWHFGTERQEPVGSLEILVLGGLPIALPLLVHQDATLAIFSTIARLPLQPDPWWRGIGLCWLALAGGWAVGAVASGQPRRLAIPASLTAMIVVLPPLPAFAIYFVCVHAPAHTAAVIGNRLRAPRVTDGRSATLLSLPVTALTLVIGGLLWPLHAGRFPQHLLSLTIQMLAALTLPHMLLEAALERRERRFGSDPAWALSVAPVPYRPRSPDRFPRPAYVEKQRGRLG